MTHFTARKCTCDIAELVTSFNHQEGFKVVLRTWDEEEDCGEILRSLFHRWKIRVFILERGSVFKSNLKNSGKKASGQHLI